MCWLIWLGFLFFCTISPSLGESVRYPPPPLPACDPLVPTKHSCISQSCTCGWCLPEDGRQIKKDHDPMGNCFAYGNRPAYIEKMCGSVNSTVYTNVDSKFCHITNIITIALVGIWFTAIFIVCMVGCPMIVLILICMCRKECRGENPNNVTISTLWNDL